MKRMLAAALLAAAAPLAACATSPHADLASGLAAGQPMAKVTVTKGYKSGLTVSGGTQYTVFDSGDCAHQRAAWRMLWTSGPTKSTPVAAGRVVVTAQTTYYYTASVSMVGGAAVANVNNWSCDGSASFVAAPGRAYQATHHSTLFGGCRMEVKDAETGEAAPDLKLARVSDCTGFYAAQSADRR